MSGSALDERYLDRLAVQHGLDAGDTSQVRVGGAQPVHTVYIPAGAAIDADVCSRWGGEALTAADEDGLDAIARHVGVAEAAIPRVADLTRDRLRTQPIEDLRIDFEDGYGNTAAATEDIDAVVGGSIAALVVERGAAPARIGLRAKAIEPATWRRGLRTIDLFLGAALDAGAPPSRLRVTLPKVIDADQIAVLDEALTHLETHHGIAVGSIGVELQIEAPHLLTRGAGRASIADAVERAAHRVTALHYGTYDYSSSLGVMPSEQSALHPVAVHARREMQVAAAVLGVEVSDGSSNRVPYGEKDERLEAWRVHAEVVRSGLREGFAQGWDLDPRQLITRYLVIFDLLIAAAPSATDRLSRAVRRASGGTMDEPATLRPIAVLLDRCRRMGVVDEVALSATGLTVDEVTRLAQHGDLARAREPRGE